MKRILSRTGLSGKELMILVFLIITFAAGLIFKYSGWKRPAEFDYSVSDREFEMLNKETFRNLSSQHLTGDKKLRAEEIVKTADSLYLYSGIKNENKQFQDIKVNINAALADDLENLPGIGSVMAERIIDFRENNGGFKDIEELKKVKGIGDKKFEKLKDHVYIE